MKTLTAACAILFLGSALSTAMASPKYSAPINITRNTEIRVRVTGSAPSPLTETLYSIAGDFNGDGVADMGTLRVACRDHAIAFASFSSRVTASKDWSVTEKTREASLNASKSGSWDVLILSVARPVSGGGSSEGKTASADSWHNTVVKEGADGFCL